MIVFSVIGFFQWSLSTTGTLVTGAVAGRQFENSDQSYITVQGIFRAFQSGDGLLWFCGFVLVLLIWLRPMRALFAALSAAVLAITLIPQPASAYYDKTDRAEVYFILPNESAFFIPDAGANKDTQAQFGSESYYKENKIAAKRYQIPHVILPKSAGYFEYDYYVPAGRLIIVDRTPVSREWVDAHDRGTANAKQGFPCQSKEGLDVTVGIAIGTSVTEDNASRFLYRFGVNPPQGNRTAPEVVFTSVYFGRSLAQIVDGPVRNKVQALVCNQIASHSLDDDNDQAAAVMAAIEKDVKTYLTDMGISLDYIGWADTFTFGVKVQDAIDRKYVADKDAKIASTMAPYTATLQQLAAAEATRTMASKWDGKMPTSVSLWWLPSSLTDFMTGMFSKGETKK